VPTRSDALTASVQDYLKEIYKLERETGRATTSAIATRLRVAASSVTAMVKKLNDLGLAAHSPYRGVALTPAGERAAVEVIRHHRLLEQYLVETLGVEIDAVHDEADRLEHALSEELEARIDESLGFPTHDPHGDPIPSPTLELERTRLRLLSELAPCERATVRRVPDDDPGLLRYLASLALVPGTRIEMLACAPFGGPVTVRVDGSEHSISRELAARIGVESR
jgi:DtxR family transcriptional regulator, Mn-dependent transcriptional regulator